MGLAAFNRMRRERKAVEMIEAERSEENLKYLHSRSALRQEMHQQLKERVGEIREAEAAASQRIGDKVLIGQGIDPATGEKTGASDQPGFVVDEPLRRDHAAEIAGRNLQGVQEDKSPTQRLDERIPSHETAAEQLVPHLTVSNPGPTPEMVEAARLEREDPARAPGAADPGSEESVAPKGESGTGTDPAGRAAEEIPQGWEGWGAMDRRNLAGRIAGHEISTVKEGDAIIREELARQTAETEAAAQERRSAAEANRDSVEIPEDWHSMSAEERKALATELTGVDYSTVAEADPVVKAEVERRAATDEEPQE